MRFKDFLLREESMYFNLENGLESIKQHCQRYLYDVRATDSWLYRGMQNQTVDEVFTMDHFKTRAPRDSSIAYNVFFNAGIEFAFDIPMVRSTTLFCSGDKDAVREYGQVYFVFPQGDYKYLWSPKIQDSYVEDDLLYKMFLREVDYSDKPSRIIADVFMKICNRSGENIQRAVSNVKMNDLLVEECFIEHDIHVTAEQVQRALVRTFEPIYFPNQDIREAIKSESEVMIYESDGNYFIPRELVLNHISADRSLDGQSPEEYLYNYFF